MHHVWHCGLLVMLCLVAFGCCVCVPSHSSVFLDLDLDCDFDSDLSPFGRFELLGGLSHVAMALLEVVLAIAFICLTMLAISLEVLSLSCLSSSALVTSVVTMADNSPICFWRCPIVFSKVVFICCICCCIRSFVFLDSSSLDAFFA